jgi:CheY-like chemotaxis protein
MSRSRTPLKPGPCEGRLLIVCDDARDRRTMHGTLFNLGFDIAEAATGEESIALCRILHYDAILLDLIQPGNKGIETCAELRKLVPGAAILLLGGCNEQERIIEALEAGADACLSKPVPVRQLTAHLRNIPGWSLHSAQKTEQTLVVGKVLLSPLAASHKRPDPHSPDTQRIRTSPLPDGARRHARQPCAYDRYSVVQESRRSDGQPAYTRVSVTEKNRERPRRTAICSVRRPHRLPVRRSGRRALAKPACSTFSIARDRSPYLP